MLRSAQFGSCRTFFNWLNRAGGNELMVDQIRQNRFRFAGRQGLIIRVEARRENKTPTSAEDVLEEYAIAELCMSRPLAPLPGSHCPDHRPAGVLVMLMLMAAVVG